MGLNLTSYRPLGVFSAIIYIGDFMTMNKDFYAIDFGTSNSLLSHISEDGEVTLIPMDIDGGNILKSIIYTPSKNEWYFGKDAIENREENDGEGRFFRSVKKFLAEKNFKGTEVHGRIMSIEKLVGAFLKDMKTKADKHTGKKITNVVLGRPARYSLDDSCDKLAEDRMLKAAQIAGFTNIIFCPEPLAAGLNLNREETEQKVLIADFGGGTSDFTILNVHSGDYSSKDVLGMDGLFVAGDALDGRMMKDFISKHFGSTIEYQIPFSTNILKFPRKLMLSLCSPAHISILRERETWELLKEIQNYSINDEFKRQLDQLFVLVEEQLAYPVYSEIENTKIALSSGPNATYSFQHPGVKINEEIDEDSYRVSIEDVIAKIRLSMLNAFKGSNLKSKDIDKVYITGGTGQSPYIQEMLLSEFGSDKVLSSEVFQSVINGLAEFAKIKIIESHCE